MSTRPDEERFGPPVVVRRNSVLFFLDGVSFIPSTALISMTAVIPLLLEHLRATTLQFAIAAGVVSVGTFVSQPFFVALCSRARRMSRTFAIVLLVQRGLLLAFVLAMPLLAPRPGLMVWVFLASWAVFNFLAGSGTMFNVPLILKLLPPSRRAGLRGVGVATGSVIALGLTALIPVVMARFAFPVNFMVLLGVGLLFLFANAWGFWLMAESDDTEARVPTGVLAYLRDIPATLATDRTFRAMVVSCVFLVVANSLLPFYTLHAIRSFGAAEEQVALLASVAIGAGIIVYLTFGFIIDRKGPVAVSPAAAVAVVGAGVLGLTTSSFGGLVVAWALANIGNSFYMKTTSLMLGEVSPPGRAPAYVGVLFSISTLVSSVVVIVLAPVLDAIGFAALFAVVVACGIAGGYVNLRVFRPRLAAADVGGAHA